MTLQHFCADRSQYVSYKTLKVYLAAILMIHIEQGLVDPTTDESLHLICRGIHRQQDNPERKSLPITSDLLRTLKSQICLTNYSLLEHNTCSGHHSHSHFMHFFILMNACLTWNDITVTETRIVIVLHQSNTDPFQKGQLIYIYQTVMSTCPV